MSDKFWFCFIYLFIFKCNYRVLNFKLMWTYEILKLWIKIYFPRPLSPFVLQSLIFKLDNFLTVFNRLSLTTSVVFVFPRRILILVRPTRLCGAMDDLFSFFSSRMLDCITAKEKLHCRQRKKIKNKYIAVSPTSRLDSNSINEIFSEVKSRLRCAFTREALVWDINTSNEQIKQIETNRNKISVQFDSVDRLKWFGSVIFLKPK